MDCIQRVERSRISDQGAANVAALPNISLQITVPQVSTATSIPARAAVEAPEKSVQATWKPYPNFKVIVLNDDVNTFEHVANCLLKYIPHLNPDKAWALTNQVHHDGQAIVWIGPQEQAELYHMQLGWEGLTMAPLEAA